MFCRGWGSTVILNEITLEHASMAEKQYTGAIYASVKLAVEGYPGHGGGIRAA